MRPYIQIDRREQITTTAAVAADHTVKNGCRAPSLGLGVLLLPSSAAADADAKQKQKQQSFRITRIQTRRFLLVLLPAHC